MTGLPHAHPEEETLERYAMGRLEEPALGELEEHLLICETCQDRLDSATEYTGLMKAAIDDFVVEPEPAPAWKRWLRLEWLPVPAPALVGALVLLAAIVVWQPWRAGTPAEWRSVELESLRGEAPAAATALEGFALELRLNIDGLEANGATAEIVAASGNRVAEIAVTVAGNRATARYAQSLRAGKYWVRLKSGGQLLREYALTVAGR